MASKVLLVIFTKNEEQAIPGVLQELKRATSEIPAKAFEVYLWDSSSDSTASIAESMGAKVVKDKAKGLGWSYYRAMAYFSSKHSFDLLVTIDGDGQTDLTELPRFIKKYEEGYDMVVGSRFHDPDAIKYKYPHVNFFGVKILAGIITLGTAQWFTDSHGGLRVFSKSVAENFSFIGTHSYVQETIIDAVRRGFRVVEISSEWRERKWGDSRVVYSPWVYARRMLIPLLLRLWMHMVLGAGLVILGILNHSQTMTLAGGILLLCGESYRIYKIKGNRRALASVQLL